MRPQAVPPRRADVAGPGTPQGDPGAGGGESADDRHNRQLVELLNELRVALPGVQMLFGFLLAVPFSQRFSTVSAGQRQAYYVTFLAAAAASAFLIAPAGFHRIVWRQGLKRQIIHVSSGLAIVGLGFLAVAIAGSVGLVTSVLYSSPSAAVATGGVAGVLATLWFVVPLAYRMAGGSEGGHS
jgi:Family of unknown function (DUF6328)